MNEYIKREDAYKYIDEHLEEVFVGQTIADAVKQIISKVSTTDVVEVVRCKDCKHYALMCEVTGHCNWIDEITKPTDFCSYGERKDDE